MGRNADGNPHMVVAEHRSDWSSVQFLEDSAEAVARFVDTCNCYIICHTVTIVTANLNKSDQPGAASVTRVTCGMPRVQGLR